MSDVDKTSCKGTLHTWRLVVDNGGDNFRAPEMCTQRVAGELAGRQIMTSSPVATDGRYFRTYSGSVYRLGRIDPKYRAWIRRQGLKYNPKSPLGKRGDSEAGA